MTNWVSVFSKGYHWICPSVFGSQRITLTLREAQMEGTSLWDLRWAFSKLAGEPEHANKARGWVYCWTTGGKGQWEVPAPAPVTAAPPCAARHCWPGPQPHPPRPHSGYGCIHPACQGSSTGRGCSWWRAIPLTHTGRDAPTHCRIVSACVPASVLQEGQAGCWGCRGTAMDVYTHGAGHLPMQHFTFYPL